MSKTNNMIPDPKDIKTAPRLEKLPEEWKEVRLRRMDCALAKIDEIVDDIKLFSGLPHLAIAASRIEDPEEREAAMATLSYWTRAGVERIRRIGELVNEGLTVPGEETDVRGGSEEDHT